MEIGKLSRRYALDDLYDKIEGHFNKKKTKYTGGVRWFFGKADVSITEAKFKQHKPNIKPEDSKKNKSNKKTKFYEDITE